MAHLKKIPGANSVPLAYLLRDDPNGQATTSTGFLEQYVAWAPHIGPIYEEDNQKLYEIFWAAIEGYPEIEARAKVAAPEFNKGREAILSVKEHIEGRGVFRTELVQAEGRIKNLFYSGEKPPGMYWLRFEEQLLEAYRIVDREAGRVVHDDLSKLRELITNRIKSQELATLGANLRIELSRYPITMTFDRALSLYRDQIRQVHGNIMVGVGSTTNERRIRQTETWRAGGRGRGNGGRGQGRGR